MLIRFLESFVKVQKPSANFFVRKLTKSAFLNSVSASNVHPTRVTLYVPGKVFIESYYFRCLQLFFNFIHVGIKLAIRKKSRKYSVPMQIASCWTARMVWRLTANKRLARTFASSTKPTCEYRLTPSRASPSASMLHSLTLPSPT